MQIRTSVLSALLFVAISVATPVLTSAQYWRALPSVNEDKSINTAFANDEKFVYYLSKESGISNIYRIPIKGGAAQQVTKFTDAPVVRFLHLINQPSILFMRAKDAASTDYHIYRMPADGSGEPKDLTGGGDGVHSELIGLSYNARYAYYTSNKTNKSKEYVMRYDIQQNVSEEVFPNDKDYHALAWSRDMNRLLLEDPSTGALSFFDATTTDRYPAIDDQGGVRYASAMMDPMNKEIWAITASNGASQQKSYNLSSKQWKDVRTGDFTNSNLSLGGKYTILTTPMKTKVLETTTGNEIALPDGAANVTVSPKEGLILFTTASADGFKLSVMDINKKTTTDLGTIKN